MNEISRVPASKNFEFGIAGLYKLQQKEHGFPYPDSTRIMRRSQKAEFRIQNTPCLKSGVSATPEFFLHSRLKSLALNLDSPSSRTESRMDSGS